jgi:HEAT repeat protein/GTPase SAR1 family protein
LGLVERKQPPKLNSNIPPEQGSQLYHPEYEVTDKFEHKQFFNQVLGKGESPKSQGTRIAIIGEPGAGKTTLLQRTADWIFEITEQDIAIWVSLADLQTRTLEEYLLQVWLKAALKTARVTPVMEDALIELFNRKRVWLLLDGVDEMAVANSLQAIASQLATGWVSSARVVLTCRLNVWDAGKNALERFDTYRTLEFSYDDGNKPDSDQVNQFISKWFEPSAPQLGKALRTALEQRGKERIKDLVKSPLRLALMCYSWQRRQGGLPNTKAGLYQWFVETFYEWKEWTPEPFPTKSAAQKELNEALGKLAKDALNQSSSWFRLTRRQACEVLGEPDEPLFQLAIKLGWLNQVGIAEENPDEGVYAFFHPTFQEYFAALTINHWQDFLNHVLTNPAQSTYRIFEPQWKEVILLWLGREDVHKELKEQFMRALTEFDDGCWNFYRKRAYCLAKDCLTEFRDCSLDSAIISQYYEWGLNYLQESQGTTSQPSTWYGKSHEVTPTLAKCFVDRETFSRNFPLLIIDPDERKLHTILTSAEYKAGNPEMSEELINLLDNTRAERIRYQAADSLLDLSPLHPSAISTLNEIMENTQDEYIRCKIAGILLSKGAPEPQKAIATLIELLQDSEDDSIREEAFNCLVDSSDGNSIVFAALVKLLPTAEDTAITTLIEFLNEFIDTPEDEWLRFSAAKSLEEIDPGNKKAITSLVKLLGTAEDWEQDNCGVYLRWGVFNTLREIWAKNPQNSIQLPKNEQLWIEVNESATEVWIIFERADENLDLYWISHVDHSIQPHRVIIADKELIRFLKLKLQAILQSEFSAANFLLNECFPEHKAWEEWERKYNKFRLEVLDKLGFKAIFGGIEENESEENESRRNPPLDHYIYKFCESFLWNRAQNMSYPDFYHAWHGDPSPVQTLESQFADIASQLQATDKTYPIVINAQALEGETDTSAIAQALSNRIYRFIFPDDSEIPPEVSNAYQLERSLLQLKQQLQTQNLALILDKCEPNQALIIFCRKLTDVLHIAWIINQPLEPPLKGFPREQANLLSAVQSWINEIG